MYGSAMMMPSYTRSRASLTQLKYPTASWILTKPENMLLVHTSEFCHALSLMLYFWVCCVVCIVLYFMIELRHPYVLLVFASSQCCGMTWYCRYYFAVVVCDSVATASHLYTQIDGMEFGNMALPADVRFIPDGETFSQAPRYV